MRMRHKNDTFAFGQFKNCLELKGLLKESRISLGHFSQNSPIGCGESWDIFILISLNSQECFFLKKYVFPFCD